jgi:hypothetical protein
MLFVVALMLGFAAYGSALFMVCHSWPLQWMIKAGVAACLFAVIGTLAAATGVSRLYALPIVIGSLGTVPIAIVAVLKGARGFQEGATRLRDLLATKR